MTNGGPCVRRLEEALRILLKVKSRKSVIAVCNGCAALHALTSAAELFHGMTLRFATQSYTFPASCQGTLRGCRIVDTNTKLGPDLIELDLAKSEIDGIIVTNVLGNVTDLQEYEDWCRKNDKLLFLDNAATSCTTFKGSNSVNLGQGAIVSLHHTKPIGFGEGGVIIADAEYEQFIRQVINFGYDMVKVNSSKIPSSSFSQMNQEWRPQGSNYKMSEVSAAFILQVFLNVVTRFSSDRSIIQYLDGFSLLRQIHQNLYVYFKTKLQPFEGRISLAYDASDDIPIVSCFCLFFPFDVTSKHLELVRSRGIECR